MLTIRAVTPGSPAEGAGIAPGGTLISLNGQPVRDALELRFAETAERLVVVWRDAEGAERRAILRKPDDAPLGIEVDPLAMQACNNKCVFCFAHQNARGMRRALYFKDDDFRFSFLNGNFATLTNLTPPDMERIVSQRLSPLYVSVHATDRALRNRMLGNPKAPDILEQIEYFVSRRIALHTQVVLCPDLNDGEALARTLDDLARFWPGVESVALVPVGLTQYRERLPVLRTVDPEYARSLLAWVEPRRRRFLRRLGTRLAFPSDEFYLLAQSSFPSGRTYEGYPQLGNGVGGCRRFLDEFRRLERALPDAVVEERRVGVITGTLAVPVLRGAVERLNRIRGLRVDLIPVVNEFFGGSVSCAGLLTGADIRRALLEDRGRLGERVLIPAVAFKDDAEVFLDDLSRGALQAEIGRSVVRVESTARGLVREVLRSAASETAGSESAASPGA